MTDCYALFGNPLGHSKSPLLHMSFARETGQDMTYELIEAPIGGFAKSVEAFRSRGGKGCNVTLPFKLEALALATRRMRRAELAGATNCLKFENDEVAAENFDGIGLVNDIRHNLSVSLEGKRILLLGAGGAARGAVLPLLEAKPASLTTVNRTMEKCVAIKEEFARFGPIGIKSYGQLEGDFFDVVLNATSASLSDQLPPITASIFAPNCLAYDMVYGKGLTPFLRLAQSAGTENLADGIGMLVEQAAEAFCWWRGVRPNTRPLLDKLSEGSPAPARK